MTLWAPSSRVELPDGRTLDLWVDDDAAGLLPLVYFHGTPGSGLPFPAILEALVTGT